MAQTPYVLVRIKTPDKRKGFLVRRYTYQGKRFDCDHGWYKVGRGLALELAELTNEATDSLIFDVVEMEEAKKMVKKEEGEDWSRGQRPPDQAPSVKAKDFKRRSEIKEEVAAREATSGGDEDWDDPLDPADLDGSADALEEEKPEEEKPETVKATKKRAKKKAGGRRRSSTK